MDGWMDGWVGGWMDGWMDGWVGGWMDGWMDVCMYVCMLYALYNYIIYVIGTLTSGATPRGSETERNLCKSQSNFEECLHLKGFKVGVKPKRTTGV